MSAARRAVVAVPVLAACLAVAGCGGAASPKTVSTTGDSTATGVPNAAGGGRFGGPTRFPGARGLVAAVDGKTLQVQGNDSQTAVTWTSSTTFTKEVAATRADVVVGVCVMVRAAGSGGTPRHGGSPAGSAGAQASSPATAPASVEATSVVISSRTGGQCEPSGRGGLTGFAGADGGAGRPTDRPSGAPTGLPTGGRGAGGAGGFRGLGGAFGTVTAVSGSSFTVRSSSVRRPGAAPSASATVSVSPSATRTVHVTTTAATTYTRTVAATARAAAVGTCVIAIGKVDDTGAVTAASVAVRPAVGGGCTTGFGRPGATGGATRG